MDSLSKKTNQVSIVMYGKGANDKWPLHSLFITTKMRLWTCFLSPHISLLIRGFSIRLEAAPFLVSSNHCHPDSSCLPSRFSINLNENQTSCASRFFAKRDPHWPSFTTVLWKTTSQFVGVSSRNTFNIFQALALGSWLNKDCHQIISILLHLNAF